MSGSPSSGKGIAGDGILGAAGITAGDSGALNAAEVESTMFAHDAGGELDYGSGFLRKEST